MFSFSVKAAIMNLCCQINPGKCSCGDEICEDCWNNNHDSCKDLVNGKAIRMRFFVEKSRVRESQ